MPATRVTPNVDQKPGSAASESAAKQAGSFLFAVCQHGAEPAIKARWIEPKGPFRLAFSRPGLLTFKNPAEEITAAGPSSAATLSPKFAGDWLIRQAGIALGQLRGEQANTLAQQAIELAGTEWDAVHIFARDPGMPGSRGFEPGPTPMTEAVQEVFKPLLPAAHLSPHACELGARVLDIVLIEHNHWLVGHHIANEIHQCWPGGSFPITQPSMMISRAYLKMAEALAWSQLPISGGDEIVEIGSSPGGASQRLLDLGLQVTGIDPAEMDPLLLKHPRFDHWRNKSAAVRRKQYAKFRWLAADANVAPNYTLDAIEDIVTYPSSRFEGLLMTFKLSSYEVGEAMEEYLERVRSWGFSKVKVRQLASNRRECCVAAER